MIELLPASRAPASARLVYRHPVTRAAVVAACVLVVGTGLSLAGYALESLLMCYVGVLCLGSLLAFRTFLLARFLRSNWLVRLTDRGIYLQFRSYLNHRLSITDATVAFIPFDAIRLVRVVVERTETSYRDSEDPWVTNSAVETQQWVELHLGADTGPLARALRDESAKRPVRGALYRDYPVRVPGDGLVQIRWSVMPSSDAFLEALQPHLLVGVPAETSVDVTLNKGIPAAARRQRISALARAGDIVGAVAQARALDGSSLAEARALVDRLVAERDNSDVGTATDGNSGFADGDKPER